VKAAAADALPRNIVRRRQHFVVESTPEFIRVAESPGGAVVKLDGSAGPQAKVISILFQAHPALYAPAG
jgi:hypothetical protein